MRKMWRLYILAWIPIMAMLALASQSDGLVAGKLDNFKLLISVITCLPARTAAAGAGVAADQHPPNTIANKRMSGPTGAKRISHAYTQAIGIRATLEASSQPATRGDIFPDGR